MANLLKHEGLWNYIETKDETYDNTPADQKARQEEKAQSKINLSLIQNTYTIYNKATNPNVMNAKTTKDIMEFITASV